MPRKPAPFAAPEPQRRHGLTPVAFQVTRLSQAASMAFGFALHGDAAGVTHACQKAQAALTRITTLMNQQSPHTPVCGLNPEGEQ